MPEPVPDPPVTHGTTPAVSIVMPTHERTAYLREAIAGALAQTFDDFEIVVSDTTGSEAIHDIFASFDDPRIRYHRNHHPNGPLFNFQNAVRLARAPLVASLHDDDRWNPEFLARLVPPLLEHPPVALAFCDYHIMDEHSVRQPRSTEFERAHSHRDRLEAGLITGTTSDKVRVGVVWNAPQPAYAGVMRRDLFLDAHFPPGADLVYDIWATYSFIQGGYDLYYVKEQLSDYRVHSGALTAQGFAGPEDSFFEQVIADHAADRVLVGELRARLGELQWWRATESSEVGDYTRAKAEFAKASVNLDGIRATIARAAASSRPLIAILRVGKVGASKLRIAGDSLTRRRVRS